jgi:hypothetical protein
VGTRSATSTIELPLQGGTNACAAALADGLHVFVAGGTPGKSAHLLVDASARVVKELGEVALSVAEVAAGVDEMLVTGDDEENSLVLAAIDAHGNERWRAKLTTAAPLSRVPLPLIAGNHAAVLWEESDEERSTLAVCSVQDRACGPTQRIDLPGTTHRLDAVMTSAGVVVARLAGFPPLLTLMRIANGQVAMRHEMPEVGSGPVASAGAGDNFVVAWMQAGVVHARTFDANLHPLGEIRRLGSPGEVDRLSGHAGGRPVFVATRLSTKGETRESYSESLALFDDGVCAVPLPIGWVETGGWIDDTFVLIHGDATVVASAFARGKR